MFELSYLRGPSIITALLFTGPARAQDPDAASRPIGVTGESALLSADSFPPEFTPPLRVELMQARRLGDSGRHAEAAALLEALAGQLGDLRLLYHAGLARSRAGQHVLARNDFTAARGVPGLGDVARADLDAKIAAEQATLVLVRFDLRELRGARSIPLTPGTQITIEAHDVPRTTVDPSLPLYLSPGPWTVVIMVQGYEPVRADKLIEPGLGESVWQLALPRKVVQQELRFAPPRALRGLTLRLTSVDVPDVPPIERPLVLPRIVVPLTTGTWQLDATSPRYQATSTLVVGMEARPVDIVLQPRTGASAPRFIKERKLVIGVAVVMALSFYSGIALSLVGANREGKVREKNADLLEAAGVPPGDDPTPAALAELEADYSTASAHDDLLRAANLQFAGATVMTGGLGMIFGILPSLFEARRRAATIELGIGAAATVGGAFWTADYVRRRGERLGPTDPDHRVDSNALTGHRVGASMITGIGIGMTVGSALLLLTDHLRRRKHPTALRVAPSLTGVLVHGEF